MKHEDINGITLYCGDCTNVLPTLSVEQSIIVTDPPFNIGYKYSTYKDNKNDDYYYSWLCDIIGSNPAVIVHYPESLYRLAIEMQQVPKRVLSWVYNSNTGRQHRDIAYFGVKPDMRKVKQPYKNPNDKRIAERISRGCEGASLYDWFEVNQVKNVQKKRNGILHPCIMPLDVMMKVIGVLPENAIIIDPFMGSGSTMVACAKMGRKGIGIELDIGYYNIAVRRVKEVCSQPTLF